MITDRTIIDLATVSVTDWSNRNMLLIEDNPECVLLIKELFSSTGICLRTAMNGENGIKFLMQNPDTHVVLIDIRLPDFDGFQVFTCIRYLNIKVPVIAMTAAVTPEMVNVCEKAGFYGFIPKPLEINRLINMVNEVLSYQYKS